VSANVKAIPIIKIRIIGVPSLLNRDSRTGTLHAHARWCSPDACSPCVGRCNRSNARRGSGMSTGRAARGSAVCRHQGIADRNGAWNFVSAGPKPQPATPAQEVLAGLVERVTYGKGSNLSVPWRERDGPESAHFSRQVPNRGWAGVARYRPSEARIVMSRNCPCH